MVCFELKHKKKKEQKKYFKTFIWQRKFFVIFFILQVFKTFSTFTKHSSNFANSSITLKFSFILTNHFLRLFPYGFYLDKLLINTSIFHQNTTHILDPFLPLILHLIYYIVISDLYSSFFHNHLWLMFLIGRLYICLSSFFQKLKIHFYRSLWLTTVS